MALGLTASNRTGKDCVIRNTGVTVGIYVFCEVRAEAVMRGPAAIVKES
jgi:hypothetical protein